MRARETVNQQFLSPACYGQVNDISLEDYIAVKPKFAVYVPHTAGRYQKKRFRKAQCPIVERCARCKQAGGTCSSARVCIRALLRSCSGCRLLVKHASSSVCQRGFHGKGLTV